MLQRSAKPWTQHSSPISCSDAQRMHLVTIFHRMRPSNLPIALLKKICLPALSPTCRSVSVFSCVRFTSPLLGPWCIWCIFKGFQLPLARVQMHLLFFEPAPGRRQASKWRGPSRTGLVYYVVLRALVANSGRTPACGLGPKQKNKKGSC